jgi:ubiquinone/menaquinone biosynthesis C-methylase UbiE
MAAARAGFRVMAVDYEPLALRRARRMARLGGVTGIRFGRADALRLPAPRRPFDIVLDYGCLHHQRKSDWPAYLASLRRVLRPGGFLVLSVFSPKFHLFARRGRPWHIAAGAYRRCFRRAGLKELLGGDFELLELVEEHDGPRGFWHALLRLRHAAIVPNAS